MSRQSKQTTNRIVFGRGSFPRSIGGWMLEVVLSEDFVPHGFGMLQLAISNLSGSYPGKPRFNQYRSLPEEVHGMVHSGYRTHRRSGTPASAQDAAVTVVAVFCVHADSARKDQTCCSIIRNPTCVFESSIKLDQAGNLFVSKYRDASEIAMTVSIVPIARPKEAGVSGVLPPQSAGCRPSERTRDLPGRGSDRGS
ncbi:uncharacterized protein PG986_011621 [Apiospora aurea]|uniref:Uncharacterized protein n=1 Tax=Apiospora aurea TaxID=335848 RepID=A0ABR1PXM9_9PEZI